MLLIMKNYISNRPWSSNVFLFSEEEKNTYFNNNLFEWFSENYVLANESNLM